MYLSTETFGLEPGDFQLTAGNGALDTEFTSLALVASPLASSLSDTISTQVYKVFPGRTHERVNRRVHTPASLLRFRDFPTFSERELSGV